MEKWWRCKRCGDLDFIEKKYTEASDWYCDGCCDKDLSDDNPGFHGPFDTEAEARGENKPYKYPCPSCSSKYTTAEGAMKCHGDGWTPLPPKPKPDRRWWRCKGCGRTGESYQAPDWNNSPFVPSGPVRCSGCCKEEGWHGPFATEQEAKDHGYIEELSEAYVAPPFTHSDYLENVIKRQVADCKAWTFQHESVIDNKSEEDNKMSSAIFCDVCRGSFPIEETSLIVFDAIKKNREGNAIEKQKAYNSHICDTCLGTLMAEPTVAKLPWSKWTKDDDDE